MSECPFVSNRWGEDFNYELLVKMIQRRWCLLHRVLNFFRDAQLPSQDAAMALQISPERAAEIGGCAFQSSLPVPDDLRTGWDAAHFCTAWQRFRIKKRLVIGRAVVIEAGLKKNGMVW